MIVLHFLENCPYSVAALNLLREHGISHELVVHDDDSKAELIRKLGKRISGHRTMPIVFCEQSSKFIGGYSNLAKILEEKGPAGLGALCRKNGRSRTSIL